MELTGTHPEGSGETGMRPVSGKYLDTWGS